MEIKFQYKNNIDNISMDNSILQIPNGEIYNYYINSGSLIADKKTNTNQNFDNWDWSSEENNISSEPLSHIAIKSFPQLGIIPVLVKQDRQTSQIILNTDFSSPKKLAVSISFGVDNKKLYIQDYIGYTFYRIIFKWHQFAIEYITKETIFDIPELPTKGTYDIYVIGYYDEGQQVSEDSNHLTLEVTEGADEWPGPMSVYYTQEEVDELIKDYYTKEEIDGLIGNVNKLLDKLNGVVI